MGPQSRYAVPVRSPGTQARYQDRGLLETYEVGSLLRDLAGHRGSASGRLGRQNVVVCRRHRGEEFVRSVRGDLLIKVCTLVRVLGHDTHYVTVVSPGTGTGQ